MRLSKYLAEMEALKVDNVSMEGVDGEMTQEIEYMFFGLLKDESQLAGATSSEQQEQWSFKKDGAQMRVRRTEAEETTYILTSKVKVEGEVGQEEVELEVSADLFRHFKDHHADSGMIKTRYFYPIEGTDLVWEVDVFRNQAGEIVPWVKIDLEVPGPIALPAWPIEFEQVITNQNGKRTEEEQEIVGKLFGDLYITKASETA